MSEQQQKDQAAEFSQPSGGEDSAPVEQKQETKAPAKKAAAKKATTKKATTRRRAPVRRGGHVIKNGRWVPVGLPKRKGK
jgi:hypothetical protein